MPPRTNRFQRLILKLEQSLAGPDERVLESVELAEYPDSSLREVDALIEGRVAGHPVRIAVECRDHARPQGKEWIDQLAGKYRDLDVSEVVAVSRSGFTKGARQKAAKVRVRLYTLEEAEDEAWTDSVLCCFVRLLAHRHEIATAWIDFAPALQIANRPDAAVFVRGKSVGALRPWLQGLYELDKGAGVIEYLNDMAPDFLADGEPRAFCILVPFEGSDASIRTLAGQDHSIRRITFCVKVDVWTIPVDLKHYSYRGNPVALGSFRGVDRQFSIGIVHSAGSQNAFRVAFHEVTDLDETA